MSGHDHDHHHHHDHSDLSETELRVRALESVLTEKGYVDPAALDLLIDIYETKVGPRNGAQVIAKAWSDPAYRVRLLKDSTAAIAGATYYLHWLAALERLVTTKDISTVQSLRRYRDAWDHAADRTPHGQPIELTEKDF